MKAIILTLILFFCISNSTIFAGNTNLIFKISGEKTANFSLAELKKELKVHEIDMYDPNYEKNKSYKTFILQDVLNLAYGEKWKDSSYTDISFTALDGYKAVSKLSLLKNEGGFIVFEDSDFPDWEPLGRNKVNPGPLYVIWTKKDQTPKYGYPWPWQLKEINLITFKDQYTKVYPEKAAKDSPEFAGFKIFKERCLRCHSINQEGGKVGPDLNAPMNILEYRSQDIVKEFIKHPSKFRYTHMPDHKDLSETDLENLIRYLFYVGKDKKESK